MAHEKENMKEKDKQDNEKEKISPASQEEAILQFWETQGIYKKSKLKNAKGKKFYMMDGPPYATGYIHLGTALNKILKDIAMRSQRLQGKDVFDRPGYDTHGIPIEVQVEKELGFQSKKDIEAYGISQFVDKCRTHATRYLDAMTKQFSNLGVWMDWENPYLTLDDSYIESIWAVFKEADKKGLLYLGKYPVHVCTRCETAVAYNEIEYEKRKDESIYVKFPLEGKKNTFLIIWTTTPWTLPANTGVMVNPDVKYQDLEINGEHWIIAEPLVEKLMELFGLEYSVKKTFLGKSMKGWKYTSPLVSHIKLPVKKAYEVVLSARYVTTDDGSGLVHCAPGHGKEDYEVGKANGLDMPSPVGINGVLTSEAGDYAGKKALDANPEIIQDLKDLGFLVHQMSYTHDYPVCWRDKTPLLMISQPQWFLKISGIQKKLLKSNKEITWIPDWMQLRMKAWLEGINDWPVSRQRYWGTPLPIWYDPDSGEKIVIGSLKELKKYSGQDVKDLHKPGIDAIEIKSSSGKKLTRVPEVLDVWFDSGVSSWAALGGLDSKAFKKYWPADLNIEARDQLRGWWNSQLILSEIMFGKKPMANIMVHSFILDLAKRKMSKSGGNVLAPEDLIAKYGRDVLRYTLAKASKGEDFSYDEKSVADIQRVLGVLKNIHAFIKQLQPSQGSQSKKESEDLWILSKFNGLIKDVLEGYNNFRYPDVIQNLEQFLVQDLSRTYIQMIRERADSTYEVLKEIYLGLLVLYAPIIPFLSEQLWQDFGTSSESLHLTTMPKVDSKKINLTLEKEFSLLLQILEVGLAERDKAKIGLRWPLQKINIQSSQLLSKPLQNILLRQLNIKSLEIKKSKGLKVVLDTTSTPELEAEGFAREIARKVQAERKNAGLVKTNVIELFISVDSDLKQMLEKYRSFLQERTHAKKLEFVDDKSLESRIVFTIREKKIGIYFRNS